MQNKQCSRQWRTYSHVRQGADLQHLDVTADPLSLSNPPCGCLSAQAHRGIEWAIHSHPACHRADKQRETDEMST